MKTITKSDFEKIKQKALIIDVRDNWEHQQLKKLPNSVNNPFLELVNKPENYIKDNDQLSYYLLQFYEYLITTKEQLSQKLHLLLTKFIEENVKIRVSDQLS